MKAPFPYFGGKSRIADLVWERFGDVPNYVEPFAGSLAVLLMRPHTAQTETVNDIDCYLANFWRALSADPEGVAEWADWPVNEADLTARRLWMANQSEFRERMKREPHFFDAKIAGWWVWGACASIGDGWYFRESTNEKDATNEIIHERRPHLGNAGHGINRQLQRLPHLSGGRGINRQQLMPHLGDDGQGINRGETSLKLNQYFTTLAERLRRVRICCGDWSRVLGPSVTFKHGITAIFLDPPYDSHEDLYAHGDDHMSSAVRSWAIENGDNQLLRIGLCGYEEEHLMPDDWECVSWKANGGYANQGNGDNQNASKERIWFSPHCLRPQETFFHDPAWIESAIQIA